MLSDHNNEETILKKIEEIKFSQLLGIYLNSNGIESIEGFKRIHLPAIKNLSLCIN